MPGINWANIGTGAINNLIGTGMGLLLEGHNDRRQLEQQKKLQELQMWGNKEMMDYSMMKQMEMWKNTNYGAQMEQIANAGLNPALLYGKGGTGGTTTGSPSGNVSGATAPQGGMEIMNMMMQRAQIELMKAQTEKTKAEATKTAGIDTQLAGTQIKSLTQGIENQKAQEELTEIQQSIANVELHVKQMTQNAAIAMIRSELRSATATMHMLERNNDIEAKTMDEKIALIEIQLVTAALNNDAIRKGLNKTDTEIDQMKTAMAVTIRQIANAENQTAIEKQIADFNTSFGGQAAGILNAIIGGVGTIRGRKSPTTTISNTRETHIHTKNK